MARRAVTLRAFLQASARIALPVGTLGSLAFVLLAGRRTPSLLLYLFIFWVGAPYVALQLAGAASKRWSHFSRAALQTLTLVVTLVSLTMYGSVALGPPRPQPAFWFVLIPPVSCLLVAAVCVGELLLRRRPARS